MTEWLRQNSPWAIPLAFAILGWMWHRVELVLIQVRKTNGTVTEHSNWIKGHEKWAEEKVEAIRGLESRERERLQAEVVAARLGTKGA